MKPVNWDGGRTNTNRSNNIKKSAIVFLMDIKGAFNNTFRSVLLAAKGHSIEFHYHCGEGG